MGGRPARTLSTSSFTSGFSRQHPPNPFQTLQHLPEFKYIELSPSSILIHALQSAAKSVGYSKQKQLILFHLYACLFPRPSSKSSPLEQGRPCAEIRAINCYWLFWCSMSTRSMAQNSVTGIFKLQKRKDPCRPNLTCVNLAGIPTDKCICLYNKKHPEEWRPQTRQLPYSVKEQETNCRETQCEL